MLSEYLSDFRKEMRKQEVEWITQRPIEVEFKELYLARRHSGVVGKFTRKARGHEYTNPRILLNWVYSNFIGQKYIMSIGKTGKSSYKSLEDKVALVLYFDKDDLFDGETFDKK